MQPDPFFKSLSPRSFCSRSRFSWPWLAWLTGLSLLLISLLVAGGVAGYAESLWFGQLGYGQVFQLRLMAQLGLGGLVWVVSTATLTSNLWWAQRDRVKKPASPPPRPLPLHLVGRWPNLWQGELNLAWLLVALISCTSLLIWILAQQPALQLVLPQVRSHAQALGWLVAIGLGAGLWCYPPRTSWVLAFLFSLSWGWQASQQWQNLLQFWQATPFGQADPLLGNDLGFYVLQLPLIIQLQHWLLMLVMTSGLLVALNYMLMGNSLSQGYFPGWSQRQLRHLFSLAGMGMVLVGCGHWLTRYQLLYRQGEAGAGPHYTDIHFTLPLQTILAGWAIGLGLVLLVGAKWAKPPNGGNIPPRWSFQSWLSWGFGGYAISLLLVPILALGIQTLVVLPNELQRETQPIQWRIEATRRAFGLDQIDTQAFIPQNNLQPATLKANDLTVRNIRLWDSRPLLETNRQLQQLRPYYQFPAAFIDRYPLKTSATQPTPEQRQVFIAAREMDSKALPQTAQTWVNRHLVYTHGYGFTMSPVNTAGAEGLPDYFVKDIGGDAQAGQLQASNAAIAASIPLKTPRLYFGQATTNHIFAPTRVQELDYPTGVKNAYNHYDGTGGVPLSGWRRWVIAAHLQDWQLLFNRSLTPATQVLWRRQIQARVQAIAPFLQLDQQPYLVVADLKDAPLDASKPKNANPLYWMLDAYTTSRSYPYAAAAPSGVNYLRNSVKVVVDAYQGTVKFYIADPTDPILQTWHKLFPDLFMPLEQMPSPLRAHLRYPIDLFEMQSQQLLRYHVTDPVVFYNQEDQWQIPTEIYGSKPQKVKPYYLVLKLPIENQAEFVLLSPFTPLSRPNLIAWLAARSDGTNYGKLLLYQFPKQELIFGPEQLEARINQDPKISAQISLWNREGSRVLQGNLLVIPIDQSLLYVEPLYLQAEQNSLPTLARVLVMYKNKIVMGETLDQALAQTFAPS